MIDWHALDTIPHVAHLPKETACIWQAYMSRHGVYTLDSLQSWKKLLDTEAQSLSPSLFIDPTPEDEEQLRRTYGFPELTVPLLPSEPALSRILADAIANPIPGLMVQSLIASEVARRAVGAQIVVLLILDGLAYEDVVDWMPPDGWRCCRQPCLVDGLSVTHHAMPRVVGTPPLTHRLFLQGFKQRLGFTYWERDANALTDTLFEEFPEGQLTRVTEFAEILAQLSDASFGTPTYIQIVRNGLDQFCHGYRERPDIRHFLRELEASVGQLLGMLASFGRVTRVFVTADHGILWYSHQAVIQLPSYVQSARYAEGAVDTGDVETVEVTDASGCYTCLVGPDRLIRARRTNEWGFHGGISGRESLIPFVEFEHRP
jgi:hypothetical protein